MIEMFGPGVCFDKETYPPTVRCEQPGTDAASWAAQHRASVDEVLREHGAVLLRGFGVADAAGFEAVAGSLVDGRTVQDVPALRPAEAGAGA